MKPLNNLLELIKNDPMIKRFQQLETIIDQDNKLQQEYKELLNLQKIMVQRELNHHPNYINAKQSYDTAKARLLEHILMSEYLDLLETINTDINLIQSMIEDAINSDFD